MSEKKEFNKADIMKCTNYIQGYTWIDSPGVDHNVNMSMEELAGLFFKMGVAHSGRKNIALMKNIVSELDEL